MKNKIIIGVCLLSCSFATTGTLQAQDSFIYEKGKSFYQVPAYRMDAPIYLDQQNSLLFRADDIPENQSTVTYEIQLPPYVRGLFFSRDDRPGDYGWPNNTNRLLPWSFGQLEELSQKEYRGIPSNGRPSLWGDALLLELEDGQFLFAKAVSGENSLSWFQVNPDGSLTLYLSTLGSDRLSTGAPALLQTQAETLYQAIRAGYQLLSGEKEVASIQKRTDKRYFEAFRYLGWCTWEQYHTDIDEAKIVRDLAAIEASGLPIRYVLIDDGHIAHKNRQLLSLTPDKERFPNGWKRIMAYKRKDTIQWIGLWYSLSGYWMGISPDHDFPDQVGQALYPYNGCLLPGKSAENIQTFYQYYVKTLRGYGFDFLKIDNQSFTLPLYMGTTDVVRQARTCNLALEEETHQANMGLINCMAQNVVNIDHTLYSAVARVSIDYKKFDRDMAKSHLFQSYTNTLLQGETVWPDHDMFHSSDSICGSLMARSKALSGGPVYLSDAPENFVKENILPLIDGQGKLFRPLAPAIPTPECILSNPLQDGNSYRVFAPTGDLAVSLICYNLNTSPTFHTIQTTIRKSDYNLRKTIEGITASQTGRVLVYDWENKTAEELTTDKTVVLNGFTDRLFHLCPIENGWSVIGLEDTYLSPATVRILSCTNNQLVIDVLNSGTLCVWVEKQGKQELRRIPIDAPHTITIHK